MDSSYCQSKKKKSLFILKTLKKQKYDYLILISAYKTLIYILLHLKEKNTIKDNYADCLAYKNTIINMPLHSLIQKNSIQTIKLAFTLLKQIEICLQYEQITMIWMHLQTLSILLS
ncbi:hypothetical protein [Buchnera aphidicola]|uniref:hypothetical protein n=1 Tax=Buchnera aphidicola TaxID=9 RepID=UPI003D7BDF78